MIKKIASIGVVGLVAVTAMVLAFVAPSYAQENNNGNNNQESKKVFVCKYVGTPGVSERLQTGNNPISVSTHAIEQNGWDGTVPGWFSDKHGRSYVLSYDNRTGNGQEGEPSIDECPAPEMGVASAKINITDPTCYAGAILTYGDSDVENAFFRTVSYPVSGTEGGPVDYRVVAKANPGALFPAEDGNADNGVVTQDRTRTIFKGTLEGQLSGPQCDGDEEVIASASITITPASCEAAATMTYGDIENAEFSGTASGTAGGDYEVIATADKGAYFVAGDGVSDDQSTMTFKGTLDPIVTEGCVLGEETPETPVTPEVLPATGAATPFATIAILAALTGVLTLLGQGVRNVLARKF